MLSRRLNFFLLTRESILLGAMDGTLLITREVCFVWGGGGGRRKILGESHGFQGEAVVSNRL